MRRTLLISLSAASLLALACATAQSTEESDKKHVLLINSYNRGYQWTDNETEGVRNVFASHPEVLLRIEYMDTKILNTADYYRRLRDLYALKYWRYKFDVLISTDDDALLFLRDYRDELFGDTPVVFCGVNNFNADNFSGFSRFTGVNESTDFKANLELIAELHPAARNIYVINDDLTTARSLKAEFKAAAHGFAHRFNFFFLEDVAMEDLLARVSKLTAKDLVFYLSFFKDREGRFFSPEEALPEIAAASPVPLYGAVDYMLGNGIVGGRLKNSYFQGKAAALLAMRVLRGEGVEDIPVVAASPNQYMFDYRQLQRFGIRFSDLPAGSIVIHEPETFYYKHKRIIWVTISVFAAMTMYIVFLLLHIRKCIRAQRGLQTIIGMNSSFLDYHSPENFKTELAERLGTLFPLKSELQLFKHNPHAPGGIEALPPTEAHSRSGQAGNPPPARTPAWIERAIHKQNCMVKRNQGVAFIKSDYLPGKLILLEGKKHFDDLDRDLLEIFATNLSMSIENIEKMKIEESLETARRIQTSMLPRRFDEFSQRYGVDLFAYLKPAKEVGGDFYDFFAIDDAHLCLTVGDVSEKGIPAALFMSMTKSLIRLAARKNLDPAQILFRVNRELSRENEQSMFVTVFVCVLDLETGRLSHANAGHSPPYILPSRGRLHPLACNHGPALGILETAAYSVRCDQLNKGDGLFVYSDGVTEATDVSGAFFSEARLENALRSHVGSASRSVVNGIAENLDAFSGDTVQSDDITMLYVRRQDAGTDR